MSLFEEGPPRKVTKLDSGESSSDEKQSKGGNFFLQFNDYLKEKGYDIINFYKDNIPQSQDEFYIQMNVFDENKLKDIILFNICRQGIPLNKETIMLLMKFFNGGFLDENKKKYLEVLVHFSKADSEYCKKVMLLGETLPSEQADSTLYYNSLLKSYLSRAIGNYGSSQKITEANEELTLLIKGYLKKPILLEAVRQTMELLFEKKDEKWSNASIILVIESLKIFRTTYFVPYNYTRGACLNNGLLICENRLPQQDCFGTDDLYKADLITLSGHEFTHFLARSYENNYNFFSPFKNSHEPKYDIRLQNLFFESGRTFELLLFDNIQPNFFEAVDITAAKTFLQRLDTYKNLPVISSTEHGPLNLKARAKPSAGFGVDLADEPSAAKIELPTTTLRWLLVEKKYFSNPTMSISLHQEGWLGYLKEKTSGK